VHVRCKFQDNPPISRFLIEFFVVQVRYVGFRDRPLEERQMRFAAGCREGHTEIVSLLD
jgi:Core binding factor beta subunit